MDYSVTVDGKSYEIEITSVDERWKCNINGRECEIDFVQHAGGVASLLIDGKSFEIRQWAEDIISIDGRRYQATVEDLRSWRGRRSRDSGQSGPQKITASMPGKIVRVLGREGESIEAGQGIIVIEAMKMQNEIKSPKAGTLQKILVREGGNVNAGEVVAVIE